MSLLHFNSGVQSECLKCPICDDITKNPVACRDCERIYCGKCIGNQIEIGLGCMDHLPFVPNHPTNFYLKILATLSFKCPFWENGCAGILGYFELMSHVQICHQKSGKSETEIFEIEKGFGDCVGKVDSYVSELSVCGKCGLCFPGCYLEEHMTLCILETVKSGFCGLDFGVPEIMNPEVGCRGIIRERGTCECVNHSGKGTHLENECVQKQVCRFSLDCLDEMSAVDSFLKYLQLRISENEFLFSKKCRYCKLGTCEADQQHCHFCRKVVCRKCVSHNNLEKQSQQSIKCLECKNANYVPE